MRNTDFEKEIVERLNELSAKIDTLAQIMAISPKIETILKSKTKTQQIEILSDLGFPNNVIALIAETTPETVSVRISELKKKREKKKKRKKGKREGK